MTNENADAVVSTSSPVPAFARAPVLEAEAILQELTIRQHLSPHKPLRQVLAQARTCPVAAEHAMEWLGLNGARAIGRLKRVELIQLAKSLHRIWKRAAAEDSASS